MRDCEREVALTGQQMTKLEPHGSSLGSTGSDRQGLDIANKMVSCSPVKRVRNDGLRYDAVTMRLPPFIYVESSATWFA